MAASVTFDQTKATHFDQQTKILSCQGEATIANALWAVVTWDVGFGQPPQDAYHFGSGWYVRNVNAPDPTVEGAKNNPDTLNVVFGPALRLPLLQARAKVQSDAANLAERQAREREEAARQQAFAASPAGRAEAARNRARANAAAQAEQAAQAQRAADCERAGGTWGRRTNKYGTPIGAVGCFFQTAGN